jgi:hypothetical protein
MIEAIQETWRSKMLDLGQPGPSLPQRAIL